MSSTSAITPATERPSREPAPHISTWRRLARRIPRAYREQMVRENHVRLMGEFAVLDRAIGALPQHADPRDPLEQLWRLPASLEVPRLRPVT